MYFYQEPRIPQVDVPKETSTMKEMSIKQVPEAKIEMDIANKQHYESISAYDKRLDWFFAYKLRYFLAGTPQQVVVARGPKFGNIELFACANYAFT